MTDSPSERPSSEPDEHDVEGPDLSGEVDLRRELADSGIQDLLNELDQELIGLAPVKRQISQTASLLLVDRVRSRLGLVSEAPTLHMSFTGNPGTGKTTVAMRMAEILHRLECLPTANVISVTRDDLVGEFIGHTAPKTKEVLKRAMGGVLFIDEAYYLHRPENERDYGRESIEILLQVMEDHRDELVVILAGYQDEMTRFFTSNPGFRSRVAHHIDFPDYSDDELSQIADKMLAERSYYFSDAAEPGAVPARADSRCSGRRLYRRARRSRGADLRARARARGDAHRSQLVAA